MSDTIEKLDREIELRIGRLNGDLATARGYDQLRASAAADAENHRNALEVLKARRAAVEAEAKKTRGEKVADRMVKHEAMDPNGVYVVDPRETNTVIYFQQCQSYSGTTTKLREYIAAAIDAECDKAVAEERQACLDIAIANRCGCSSPCDRVVDRIRDRGK